MSAFRAAAGPACRRGGRGWRRSPGRSRPSPPAPRRCRPSPSAPGPARPGPAAPGPAAPAQRPGGGDRRRRRGLAGRCGRRGGVYRRPAGHAAPARPAPPGHPGQLAAPVPQPAGDREHLGGPRHPAWPMCRVPARPRGRQSRSAAGGVQKIGPCRGRGGQRDVLLRGGGRAAAHPGRSGHAPCPSGAPDPSGAPASSAAPDASAASQPWAQEGQCWVTGAGT